VGNAIKFTKQGHVHIEGTEIERNDHSALLEFSVTDTGVGIAADKFALLFKPFSQTDSSMTREFGGSGLGLSIVHNLAQLAGGDAGVQSEVGKGARFWFRIRADLVAAAAPLAVLAPTLSGQVLVVAPTAPLDTQAFDALLSELTPLLQQNKFSAIRLFKQLQALAADTPIANDLDALAPLLNEMRFDLVLTRLREIAPPMTKKEL
jgi:hypothetical protein